MDEEDNVVLMGADNEHTSLDEHPAGHTKEEEVNQGTPLCETQVSAKAFATQQSHITGHIQSQAPDKAHDSDSHVRVRTPK